jgi:hypothetical protein
MRLGASKRHLVSGFLRHTFCMRVFELLKIAKLYLLPHKSTTSGLHAVAHILPVCPSHATLLPHRLDSGRNVES